MVRIRRYRLEGGEHGRFGIMGGRAFAEYSFDAVDEGLFGSGNAEVDLRAKMSVCDEGFGHRKYAA
jgi:hypothetical protein